MLELNTTTISIVVDMRYDNANRAQALTLKVLNYSNNEIERITGIPKSAVVRLFRKAMERGFDPQARPCRILDYHVRDGARSGRPTKQMAENTEAVVAKVRTDRYGREDLCNDS